ncbi:MAG: dTMP kinase [Ktedonobacteraceae bacterium]|nr:dTMP kinase [Ktedonobacteraceae bacterium]
MSKGQFISFEGLDGAGKTTQLALLQRWLEQQRISYVLTREPGGTPLGSELRHLLFGRSDLAISPLAEAFLFQADRAQHFADVIVPAIEAGKLVISDRCYDSSIAYQGAAQGVGIELVEQLSLIATAGRSPDLTILLDLAPSQVHVRTHDETRGEHSRFDAESLSFHQRLREAFLALAQNHPERIKVIDATQTPEQIHHQIIALIQALRA